jgi:hypothetical protein
VRRGYSFASHIASAVLWRNSATACSRSPMRSTSQARSSSLSFSTRVIRHLSPQRSTGMPGAGYPAVPSRSRSAFAPACSVT